MSVVLTEFVLTTHLFPTTMKVRHGLGDVRLRRAHSSSMASAIYYGVDTANQSNKILTFDGLDLRYRNLLEFAFGYAISEKENTLWGHVVP